MTSAVLRDPSRLAALRSTGLLDPQPDDALERLTRVAVQALGAPLCAVGLVGRDRPVFKGLTAPPELAALRDTPVLQALCRHTVEIGEPLIVSDASTEPQLRDTAAVADLGLLAWVSVPLTSADGHVLGAFCAVDRRPRSWTGSELETARDIAAAASDEIELRRASALAQLGERRLMQAQALAGIGSWEWDLAGGEATWSSRVYEIMGVDPAGGPLDQHDFIERVHPADRDAVTAVIEGALSGEGSWYAYECRITRPDGDVRVISVRADVEIAAGRVPVRATGIIRDVTAERTAEQQLSDTARRLAEAQELGGMGSWEWRAETGELTASDEMLRILGFTPAGAKPSQADVMARIHPEDRDRVDRIAVGAHTDGDERYSLECRIVRPDGDLRWVRARGEIERDASGRVTRSRGIGQDITERRTAASRLAAAESLGQVGSWEWDVKTDRATWSPQLYRIFGLDPARFTPSRDSAVALAHPEDRAMVGAALDAAVAGDPLDMIARALRSDGELRWIRVRAEAPRDATGDVIRLTGTMQDVTERRRVESLLHEAEGRFGTAFDSTGVGMALIDLDFGRFVRVNRALCIGFGLSEEEVRRLNPSELVDAHDPEIGEAARADLLTGRRRHLEFEHRQGLPNGDVRCSLVHLAVVRDDAGRPLYHVLQARDITEQRRAEEQVRFQALHHPLTRLPNRTLLLDRLRHALLQAARRGSAVAVIAVDVDRFRTVKERFGLPGGDRVLTTVGPRLIQAVRTSDTVAHLGEDTFAVVCEDLVDEHEALELAERLQRAVRRRIDVDGHALQLTASIGVALASHGDQRPEDLVRDAESAARSAGERGGGRWEVFDPALRARVVDRLALEHQLRAGIDGGELRLHYQPITADGGTTLMGFEALVRWQHPDRGLLHPGAFLPVAEESGLDVPLGSFVLREACRQAVLWSDEDPAWDAVAVSVNVTARQLDQPDFVEEVAGVVADAGIRPSRLRLELTESDLMHSADPGGVVARLKALGVRVILDDFGTGYSSLSHLRRFPVDGLKIDRSFIADIHTDAQSAKIVDAIVSMARALGLTVVAEGVETDEQLASVSALGCQLSQGFLLGRPMPPADIRRDRRPAGR